MLIALIRVTIAIISRLLHGATYRISFLEGLFNIFIMNVYLFNFYHAILAVTIVLANSYT